MSTPYWKKVCDKAHARKAAGKPAFTEHQKLLSNSFVTCACGKQDERIRRKNAIAPFDLMLDTLGFRFNDFVRSDNPTAATETLAKIERRAAEVLADL